MGWLGGLRANRGSEPRMLNRRRRCLVGLVRGGTFGSFRAGCSSVRIHR